jgi:hypothetical protein
LDKKGKECKKIADKLAQAEDEIANLFAGLQKANADRDKLSHEKKVHTYIYIRGMHGFVKYKSKKLRSQVLLTDLRQVTVRCQQ